MPGLISSPEMPRSPATAPKSAATPPATYELALAELDRLVVQMEGGQLPLDELLDGYRRGTELLAFCNGRLQAVEEQVKVLEDGQLKPWVAA
jgi:exodeoxyribonuclease VII small subunit